MLAEDEIDIAMGGITSAVRRDWGSYRESEPYLYENLALLVKDHRVGEFRNVNEIGRDYPVRFGILEGQLVHRIGLYDVNRVTFEKIPSVEDFVEGRLPEIDGLLSTAETGSIYTMIEPRLSIVIPDGVSARIPVIFATAEEGEFSTMLDTWIRLKREDGTVDILTEHWIYGKETKTSQPRWSVIRDVLGWVD